MGTRDPNRKWGHYDSSIPIVVDGSPLRGRITEQSANGTYDLIIKNFDWSGGLTAAMNQGEVVSLTDYSGVQQQQGKTVADNPVYYWRDFDNSGAISLSDFNMIQAHLNHNCTTPSP